METDLREAMTAGVMVEFRDAQGHTVAQAVYTDWRGRPVPNVGDTMCCDGGFGNSASGRQAKLLGRVCSRQFDIQFDAQGEPSVWVLLVAETLDRANLKAAASAKKPQRVTFSLN